MSESIVELSENTFDQEIGSTDEPVLVDFGQSGVDHTKMIAPILEEIAVEKRWSI